MPFGALEELIRERLEEIINNATPDEADLPDGVTIQIQFGGVAFSVTDLAGQTGEVNDPSSSNDDLIDVDISINWAFTWSSFFGGAAAVGTMHVHLLLMFPQDAPSEVHPTLGHRCKYARRIPGATQVDLIGVLPRCEDQSPPIEGCDAFWYYLEPLRQYWDASFYHDVDHPERADWLDAAQTGRYLSPTEFLPNGCMYTYLEPCEFLARRVPEAENHRGSLCQTCARPQYTFHEFNVPFSAFPGVWAVEVSYSDVPYFPYADIERRVRESLQEEGLLDVEILGQHWSGGCALQEQIAPEIDPMLDAPVDDSLPLTLRELIRQSGGVRVSDTTQSIDLLIPPVQPANPISGAPMDDPDCTPRGVHYAGLESGSMAEMASRVMDFPKVAQLLLSSDATAVNLGLHVVCDQGLDCEANGYTDSDGDGFCDAWVQGEAVHYDHCPDTVTGVNCDSDHDGFGDGHSFIWAVCGPVDPVHASYEEKAQESFRRQRQLYCGGCDNCQMRFNPETYHPGFDGHVELTASWSPTDAVLTLPTSQYDFDNDWLGDACDPDIDGDGVANDWDCHEKNPCIGPDLDQDGVCDDWSADPSCQAAGQTREQACISRCSSMWGRHGQDTGYFSYLHCYQQCAQAAQGFDNCAPIDPASDAYCGEVLATCANPSSGSPCDTQAAALCTERYANPLQENTFGSPLVGDQCETGIAVSLLPMFGDQVEPESQQYCSLYGENYRVGLNLYGGDVVAGTSGQPVHVAEYRTAVEAGACACPEANDEDGWLDECATHDCKFQENEQNSDSEKAWNPVHAPEIGFSVGLPGGPRMPIYPVFCPDGGVSCDFEHQSAHDNVLAFGRRMPFRRDPTRNAVDLTWDWQSAKQFPFAVPQSADPRDFRYYPFGDRRTTRIRAAWPDHGHGYPDELYTSLVSYTDPVRVRINFYDGCIRGLRAFDPWWWLKSPYHVPDFVWRELWVMRDRPFSGLLFGYSPELGKPVLYGLGQETMKVERAWVTASPVSIEAGLQSANVALLPGNLAGQETSETVLAMALYVRSAPVSGGGSAGPSTGDDSLPGTAHLLLGALEDSETVTFFDTASLAGQAAPLVEDARVVVLSSRRQVILVGHTLGNALPAAWRLDLATGEWQGPRVLLGLGERQGFALAYDSVRDRLIVFGGRRGGSASAEVALGDVQILDPDSLLPRPLETDLPEGLARSRAGAFLDAVEQELFVVGGQRDGVTLSDGFVLDIRRGTWTPLSMDQGPEGAIEPFVYRQRRSGRLWIGDLEGTSALEGLVLWAREPDGVWTLARTSMGQKAAGFPVQATYLLGRPATYYLAAPQTAAWPGQIYLASISSEAAALGVRAQSSAAEALGTSWPEGADSEQAAFLCPPGETCRLSVQPGEGYGGEALPFTLDAGEAELQSEEDLFVAMPMQDLALWEKSAVIATPAGIGVLDGPTRQWQAALIGNGVAAGQALTPCGGYLCLARLGARGLTVLDLSDPGNPAVRTRAFTAGLGWDVAASGKRVFVAHGIFGVGIYAISDRGEIAYQDSLIPGGLVRSVAADSRLLAAARRDGRIQLFSLAGGLSPAGQVQAAGQISRIRLVAGKLWVLSGNEARLEIFDLTDLTAPARIGNVTTHAAETFRRRFAGPLAFSYSGRWLRIRRATRVTP